jgi:hypothetical protein
MLILTNCVTAFAMATFGVNLHSATVGKVASYVARLPDGNRKPDRRMNQKWQKPTLTGG